MNNDDDGDDEEVMTMTRMTMKGKKTRQMRIDIGQSFLNINLADTKAGNGW